MEIAAHVFCGAAHLFHWYVSQGRRGIKAILNNWQGGRLCKTYIRHVIFFVNPSF
jgi:hypothetical protein